MDGCTCVSVHDMHVVKTVCPLMPEVPDNKVTLLFRDLWRQGTDSFHDMHVVNTDALTHRTKDPKKYLHEAKRGNRRYIWRLASSSVGTSPPFVASVYGLLGVDATATLKRLASRLATKWKQSYSKTCG